MGFFSELISGAKRGLNVGYNQRKAERYLFYQSYLKYKSYNNGKSDEYCVNICKKGTADTIKEMTNQEIEAFIKLYDMLSLDKRIEICNKIGDDPSDA